MNDKLNYFVLFQEYANILPQKINNIEFLLELIKKNGKVAITCFEKNYVMCHRNKIAEFVKKKGRFEFGIMNL